jgi:hypothetical protein
MSKNYFDKMDSVGLPVDFSTNKTDQIRTAKSEKWGWYPNDTTSTEPPERKKMGNKFLPFIVESSSQEHIFKTLLSRSKGMNRTTVAGVFNMALQLDINLLRKVVSDFPEMGLEEMYTALLQKYPMHIVSDGILSRYEDVIEILFHFHPEEKWYDEDKLGDFAKKDVAMFIFVLNVARIDTSDYSNFEYIDLLDPSNYLDKFYKHVKFCDNGTKMEFATEDALRNYISYAGIFGPQMSPKLKKRSICASFSNKVKPKQPQNWGKGENSDASS